MSTCSPIADILWTLLRQLTIVSRTGYNDAGQGISSHELQLRDLPSKRLLGEGLAGIGYETEWKGERYARKEFVGVPSDIFREEAANLVGLEDHKNIVKTYGWTVDKRSCSLVLDLMDDDLLGLLLKRKEAKWNLTNVGSGTRYKPSHFQPFELPEALNVITEIAEGMKQLHDKRIEHGDLKTRNILVKYMNDSRDSNSLILVKVADFGLVRTKRKSIFLVSPQARKLDMVQWKAPEYLSVLISLKKLEDKDETSSDSDSSSEENTALIRSGVDIRRLRGYDVFAADVYSFALTCSQILTGEDPYPNSNWKELVEKILISNLRPTLLDAWPPSLKELLQSCWDKDPSKRPTFSDIMQILQVIQANVENLDFKETPTKFPHKEDSEHTSMGTFSEDGKTGIEKRKDSRKSQEEAIQVLETVSPIDASTSGIIVMSGTSKSRPKHRTPQTKEEPNNENSNLRNSKDYDVFLNFRGHSRLQKFFVSHLAEALHRVGCHPFLEVNPLLDGSSSFNSIKEAFHGVLVHVAIFSPGYAESQYCLNELCDILASGKPLIPVFYDVKPEDLRWIEKEQGPFAKAFIRYLEEGLNEDVERWRRALFDVSMREGFISDDFTNDMELQKKVVAAVLGSLSAEPALFAPHRVGLKNISMDMVNMLHKMGENVGVMGICGTGGIGKTTFVREVYNQMQLQFENRCFLEDVKDAKSVMDLQMKMVTDLLQVDVKKIHWDFAHWFEKIQKQKVLLVVDDINKREQFYELVVDVEKLAPGSRVLITSRESGILDSIMADVPQAQCALYPMPMLSFSDSLELLHQCVFQEKISDVDDIFRVSSQEIIMETTIPLALEVIGGFLADRKNEPECWREAMSALRESHGIISKLHIIYDGLQNDIDKCLFEDIACFMLGHSKHIVLEVWNSVGYDLPASGSLQRLIDKYLVKVDGKGQLRMHDLLRDMGREVVMNRAGRKLDLHSHIWHPSRAAEILQKRHGLNEVLVALSVVGVDHHIAFKAESYARMRALRYLSLDGYGVVGDFSGWSMELRWLQWRYMPFEELPSSLELLNLVVLDLASSPCLTRVWATIHVPYNFLRVLILRECTNLEKLPQHIDKMLARLKLLDLEGCSSLSSLPSSLCNLTKLRVLNVKETALEKLPYNFGNLRSLRKVDFGKCKRLLELPESFGNLFNLEEVLLNGCELLQELPSSLCNLGKLNVLDLKETALEKLLHDFGDLQSLRKVDLRGCKWLFALQESFGNLFNLEELLLNGCELLQKLPSSLGNLTNLMVLNLKETALEELPYNFGDLRSLRKVDFGGCKRLLALPNSFGNLFNLEEVLLNGCELLQNLPSSLCNLTKLVVLNLKETALEELPKGFGNLESLGKVDFGGCKRLVELPESFGNLFSLEEVMLNGCELLQKLPSSLCNLTKLRVLNVKETALEELPKDFGNLESLRKADFGGCKRLVELPKSFGNLFCLEELLLNGCELLQKLPSSLCNLTKLTVLNVKETALEELPKDFGNLESLRKADFGGCNRLVELPKSFGNLFYLEELLLNGCELLQKLPSSLCNLTNLMVVNLTETALEELPKQFGDLESLRKVDFGGCKRLLELPESFGNLFNLEELLLNGCELLQKLPSSLCNLTKLMVLNLKETPLEELPKDFGRIESLRKVDFGGCKRLLELPESFWYLFNLEELLLNGCELLQKLPFSLCNLTKLKVFNVKETALEELPSNFGRLRSLRKADFGGCKRLVKLPESLGYLFGLEEVLLNGCELLHKLPSSLGNLTNLMVLNLKETAFEELPYNFGDLRSLRKVDFGGCKRLLALPNSFGNLFNLEEVLLNGCELLQNLPSSLCNLTKLVVLNLKETALEELPKGFGKLESLRKVDFGGCKRLVELPESFWYLFNLEELLLNGCELLPKLPSSLCNLTKLMVLNLKETALEELPKDFGRIESLRKVDFGGCKRLLELPKSFWYLFNLEELLLNGCELLQKLPSSLGNLTNLMVLNLKETALEELPYNFGRIESLRKVDFGGCKRLLALPNSFGNLFNLEEVLLNGCELLQNLPSSLCNLTKLVVLNLKETALEELPKGFGNLESLRKADFGGCKRLVELPESFGKLFNIQELFLNGCELLQELSPSFCLLTKLMVLFLAETALVELPVDFGQLHSLQEVHFEGCKRLVQLPESFGQLQNLKEAYFDGCKSLIRLPDSFSNLLNLEKVSLYCCELLRNFPLAFGRLKKLEFLDIRGTGMTKLPVDFGQLESLSDFYEAVPLVT